MGISSQLASPGYVGPWSSEQRWIDWMPEWARAEFLVPLIPGSSWFRVDGAGITAGLVLIALLAYAGWKSKEIRRLWLAVAPLWMLLAVAFQSDSQPRHLLLLIAVVFISLALVADRVTWRWRPGRYVVAVSVLVPALILVSSQLASSLEYRSGEDGVSIAARPIMAQPGTIVLADRSSRSLAHACRYRVAHGLRCVAGRSFDGQPRGERVRTEWAAALGGRDYRIRLVRPGTPVHRAARRPTYGRCDGAAARRLPPGAGRLQVWALPPRGVRCLRLCRASARLARCPLPPFAGVTGRCPRAGAAVWVHAFAVDVREPLPPRRGEGSA